VFRYIIEMGFDKNPWDILAETTFNTNVSIADIESNAADNIIISWPVIIDCIQQYVTLNSISKALDFGCGVGLFSRKLNELGFSVTGVDSSISMIDKLTLMWLNLRSVMMA
jgi:2-polyprenyl-3-methyl-5-hydroxy-6-metoxy-1,4-benzoquinol methylase